jgi:hypothetical protein
MTENQDRPHFVCFLMQLNSIADPTAHKNVKPALAECSYTFSLPFDSSDELRHQLNHRMQQ